ncbi:MAG: calcium-binding protein [Geminicoccaceae bacterium]
MELRPDKLWGDAGNDALNGGNGNDTIWGGKGNDRIDGFSGNDILYGGDGNDTIYATRGLDTVYGGNGDDWIYHGVKVDAGAGDDYILTGSNSESPQHNVITAGPGSDHVYINFFTDGKQDIVEITDFDANDEFLFLNFFGEKNLSAGNFNVILGEVTKNSEGVFEFEARGHDLVISTPTDGDQLILRDAADWLHIT